MLFLSYLLSGVNTELAPARAIPNNNNNRNNAYLDPDLLLLVAVNRYWDYCRLAPLQLH